MKGKLLKPLSIAALAASAVLFAACGNAPDQTSANTEKRPAAVATKDSIDEFLLLVKLPFEPVEVTWREEPMRSADGSPLPDRGERRIRAVIRFSPEDSAKFLTELERSEAKEVQIAAEEWFPAELKAQSEVSGSNTVSGRSFSARELLTTPYSDGRIVKVEGNDYFLLEMFAN